MFIDALLAQLVEHLTLNQGVQGSSPWRRTKRKLKSFLFFCFTKIVFDMLFVTNNLRGIYHQGIGDLTIAEKECRLCIPEEKTLHIIVLNVVRFKRNTFSTLLTDEKC